MTDLASYLKNIIEHCITAMKSPYLEFNYLIINFLLNALLFTLTCALITKVVHDSRNRRYRVLWTHFSGEIESLFFCTDSTQVDLAFLQRLDAYFECHRHLLKKSKQRAAFEDVLLLTMSEREDTVAMGRQTAYRFSLPKASCDNLKSISISRQMRGCQQAGAYLYKPAIPLLLNLLRKKSPQLQYNVLLALADFRRPGLVVESFKIIENDIIVNERIFREIVSKMDDQKTELFGAIFELNSPILTPSFLKYIDADSANVYLDQIIVMGNSEDTELRIAAIRGIAASKNSRGVPALIQALQAEEWEIRAAAAKGLKDISTQEADDQLLCAIFDNAWWVRYNAALALLTSPNRNELVEKTLQTEDPHAISSLQHAAHAMGMADIVTLIHERGVEADIDDTSDVCI